MLKADLTRFLALASTDEAARVAAAQQLQALPRFHFDERPVEPHRFPEDWGDAVAAAWHATTSDVVRAWIAQGVALARPWPCTALEPLLLEFLDIVGPYFKDVVGIVVTKKCCEREAKCRVLALQRHPDPSVRAELALRLSNSMATNWLEHASDAAIVHSLMLDPDPSVREYAVAIAEGLEGLGREDVEVLLDVVNMDSGKARIRAQRLIDSLCEEIPGCTPESFAMRVPLLRTDGLYSSRVTQFDTAGRWMTSRCLRFFADCTVHEFGANEPFDFLFAVPSLPAAVQSGSVRRDGAALAFTVDTLSGAVEYAGRIDGSRLYLTRLNRATGETSEAMYEYCFVDWDPIPASRDPAALTKPRGKADVPVPFERLKPNSLIFADAAKWYWQMAARLPIFIDGLKGDKRRFERTWFLKNEMRNSAAKALFDSSLRRTLFETFPLPDIEDLLSALASDSPDFYTDALRALEASSADGRRSFSGPYPEAIGTMYVGVEGTFVMTEQGWRRR